MEILDTVNRILSLKMKGDKWCAEAVIPLVEIAGEIKELSAKKMDETAPMREAIREVDAKYKPALDVLSEMDGKLRERVMKEHEGAESVLVDGIGELVFPLGSWEIEVTDLKKVDPKYLTVDKKAVEKDAKGGVVNFKGMIVSRGRSLRVLSKDK